MRDGNPFAVGPAAPDAVAFTVTGIDTALIVRFQAVRGTLLTKVDDSGSNRLLRG